MKSDEFQIPSKRQFNRRGIIHIQSTCKALSQISPLGLSECALDLAFPAMEDNQICQAFWLLTSHPKAMRKGSLAEYNLSREGALVFAMLTFSTC